MEEDIKILEEFIGSYKISIRQRVTRNILNCIENLIKRNKELEEYYKAEKVIWNRNDYIPKSKIKEKIELIENVRIILPKRLYSPEEVAISTIKVLQELLED